MPLETCDCAERNHQGRHEQRPAPLEDLIQKAMNRHEQEKPVGQTLHPFPTPRPEPAEGTVVGGPEQEERQDGGHRSGPVREAKGIQTKTAPLLGRLEEVLEHASLQVDLEAEAGVEETTKSREDPEVPAEVQVEGISPAS